MRWAPDTKYPNRLRRHPCKLTFDDVYIVLAQRIDTSGIPNDVVRTFFEEAAQCIMNYINLPYVPCELRFIVCQILLDVMNYYKALNEDTSDPDYEPELDYGAVTDVKVGDTQVKLGGTTSSGTDKITARGRALNSHIPDLDSFVFNYATQLNPFRSIIPQCR